MTTYLGSGDESLHRRDYQPEWLGRLAEDVTMEASVLNGIVHGPAAVREILTVARSLYDYQEFTYAGPYGERDFVEDYTSRVHGEPIGTVVVIRFNDVGLVQHIVINHRPLKSVLLWSRLMGEHFAGAPCADYFLTPAAVLSLLGTEATS